MIALHFAAAISAKLLESQENRAKTHDYLRLFAKTAKETLAQFK
jgi:hypothetical protein